MDNIDIIYDELTRNKIDIDKQTLSFYINTILNRNRDLYREMNVDLEKLYRELNITNVGRIFAYLTLLKEIARNLFVSMFRYFIVNLNFRNA